MIKADRGSVEVSGKPYIIATELSVAMMGVYDALALKLGDDEASDLLDTAIEVYLEEKGISLSRFLAHMVIMHIASKECKDEMSDVFAEAMEIAKERENG